MDETSAPDAEVYIVARSHEVGHIVAGDLDTTDEELSAALDARKTGVVLDMGLRADRFAVDHCSSLEVLLTASYFTTMGLVQFWAKSSRELKVRAVILRRAAKDKKEEEKWIS